MILWTFWMSIIIMRALTKGFIYVASSQKIYYEFAIESAQSLKDFYPESNVTLFTHDAWVDDRACQLFDKISTGIPVNPRAKMWCMARTPYDQTFYNDVDSFIVHKDIKTVFDSLKENDIFMCENVWHVTGSHLWSFIDLKQNIPVEWMGATCWYNKNEVTLDFMQTWFDEYIQQVHEPWPYSEWASDRWQQFDMFTLWKITSGQFSKFKRFNNFIKKGDKRFNTTMLDGSDYFKLSSKPPVNIQISRQLYQTFPNYATLLKRVDDERNLPPQPKIEKNSLWYN